MSDVLLNAPRPAPALPRADSMASTGLAAWLGELLDMARDREEAPLVRLIAGVIDDLGGSSKI